MDMSSMDADRVGGSTTQRDGAHQSDPRTWCSWTHHGRRLWAGMPAAFWVYIYKVRRCPDMGRHDWRWCPFAHNGERTRRRDPRVFTYLADGCPDHLASQQWLNYVGRPGAVPTCARGLHCRYAHGAFERGLHPARFRTRMCDAGPECRRRVCFFAHSDAERRAENDPVPLAELLTLPPPTTTTTLVSPPRHATLGASSSSASPSPGAVPTAAAAAQASPGDDVPAGRSGRRRASEDGSVTDDYPHFDLIRDIVMS